VPARHLSLGVAGENLAREHLTAKGYEIIDANWRDRGLELDLVCRLDDLLVFVEVKTRTQGGLTTALESLGKTKQARLVKAASSYLSRFDLVCVSVDGDKPRIEHVQNAFDFGSALGRGHAAWQPW
jgi:putative endonuclease